MNPGAVQPDEPVAGEEGVEATPAEVYSYANALAIKNGFAPLAGGTADQKNPDHVVPGERLVLPDGRILQLTTGQYIYDIAGRQYRRDMARIRLLDQQARGLVAVWQTDRQDLLRSAFRERLTDMERLAVTPRGRAVVEDLNRTAVAAGLLASPAAAGEGGSAPGR